MEVNFFKVFFSFLFSVLSVKLEVSVFEVACKMTDEDLLFDDVYELCEIIGK